jgi:hypothetical protein
MKQFGERQKAAQAKARVEAAVANAKTKAK